MALKLRGDTIIDECGKTLLELTEQIEQLENGGDGVPINSIFEYEGDVVPDGYEELPSIIDVIYPLGSIYMSVNNIDPGTLFEDTTWEQIKDTFLLSAGDTYKGGETGGESEVTLTVEELPSHSHDVNDFSYNRWGVGVTGYNDTAGYNIPSIRGITGAGSTNGLKAAPVGGDKAHNNMPPYLAVYMWKRIG